jgi:Uma2 family endonuclease
LAAQCNRPVMLLRRVGKASSPPRTLFSMHLPQPRPEPISIDDFLPILHASEIKLELIEGQIVPFANGTMAHGLVTSQIVRALKIAAKPGYQLLTSDSALRHPNSSTYVSPDASYTCETIAPDADSIVAPRLVVEVMSPLSVERDRVSKLDCYQAIPSVEEYLIVDSRRVWACVYCRYDGIWIIKIYGPDDTIELLCLF